MHLNLECPDLPQKSHFSISDCDLEEVITFSKPKLDLSWGCRWNFKSMVRVCELFMNFPNSFVRQTTSSLSFSTMEGSSILLAWLKLF